MSYIVNNAGTTLIAEVKTSLPSGTSVRYSRIKTGEAIDAAREFNLVNAFDGKISNAKKWASQSVQRAHMEASDGEFLQGTEINPGEFLIA